QLFDEVAERRRDHTAVTDGETRWSYGDVRLFANRLANRLRRLGVGQETPVATLAARSPELITALLAILKAGGAYVPLDAQAPPERLAHVLRDTAAPVVIASREMAARVPAGNA